MLGSPEEAGALVSYLNNVHDATRINQNLPPFNVNYFELGNEISWSTERGHDQYASTEIVYATRAKLFAAAMRANSSIPIQIGLVGGTNSNWYGNGWSGQATTVTNIINIMKTDVDFIIYHGYPSWPLSTDASPLPIMAQNTWNRNLLSRTIFPAIEAAMKGNNISSSHTIKVANTEYFTSLYQAGQRGTLEALYTADTMVTALNLDIFVANNFCFDHGDLADSLFFINNDPNNTTPIYATHKLVAESLRDLVVSINSSGLSTSSVKDQAGVTTVVESLSYVATIDANHAGVTLLIVNKFEQDQTASVSVLGSSSFLRASQNVLVGKQWSNTNMIQTSQPLSTLSNIVFPAASISIIDIVYQNQLTTTARATTTTTTTTTTSTGITTTTSSGSTTGKHDVTYLGCYLETDNNRSINAASIAKQSLHFLLYSNSKE
eukprot:TRINITY_DN6593_c1_g1_i6.p1 TRINITY_DN6593_c1_g1~~TRINITY_DN6593_c1_g1_i6.p1  ORF type:complete len:435 (+),score=71.31 TRINITY_DN6593_c1_g1_i6:592-1896(+)